MKRTMLEGRRRADEVDAALTEAAKSKQAVAGLDEVHRELARVGGVVAILRYPR